MKSQTDPSQSHSKLRLTLGWIAVLVATAISCFWAFWGIIENFHEGWYQESLWDRVVLMLVQYLGVMFVFMIAALVAIRWRWVGLVIHLAMAGFAAWFFSGASALVLWPFIVGPLIGLALGFFFGIPEPKRWAYRLIVIVPLLTMLILGAEPAIRVANRYNDGNHDARTLKTELGHLTWAPLGPGWPIQGVSWDEATRRCRYLSEDGTQLMEELQNIWRLPTVEEVVAFQHRGNELCNGQWDPEAEHATYETRPDKESPLWNLRSPIIYWWTSTEIDDDHVWMIAYDGRVWPRKKQGTGHRGFRAVKPPTD